MRPNFFVNTPDILHAYLQYGGPAAFKIRAVAGRHRQPDAGASTPATSCSSTSRSSPAARSTSTPRSTSSGPATGTPPRPRAGRSRRTSPGSTRSAARTRRCSCCATSRSTAPTTTHVLVFSKQACRGHDDTVIVVVNLDPHATRETTGPPGPAGARPGLARPFVVHDELTGADLDLGRAQLRPPRPVRRAGPHPHGRGGPAWSTVSDTAIDAFAHVPDETGDDPRVVQARGLLRGPGARVPRLQRRRHRRLRGPDREARLPRSGSASTASGCRRSSPRRCATAATTSPTTRRAARVRHRRRLPRVPRRRPTPAASG